MCNFYLSLISCMTSVVARKASLSIKRAHSWRWLSATHTIIIISISFSFYHFTILSQYRQHHLMWYREGPSFFYFTLDWRSAQYSEKENMGLVQLQSATCSIICSYHGCIGYCNCPYSIRASVITPVVKNSALVVVSIDLVCHCPRRASRLRVNHGPHLKIRVAIK